MLWLAATDTRFPSAHTAPAQAPLAVGGDLAPERLLQAYTQGIFPWYNEPPILWWSPDPRMILVPDALIIHRSLRKTLKQRPFTVRFDTAFGSVMHGCAAPRNNNPGTWITAEMIAAYKELHRMGFAHSVESWCDNQLVGGLYGIALGSAFFGESMFSLVPNASKVAFVTLVTQLTQWGYTLIDCQVASAHLATFGAVSIPRSEFLTRLATALQNPQRTGRWATTPTIEPL